MGHRKARVEGREQSPYRGGCVLLLLARLLMLNKLGMILILTVISVGRLGCIGCARHYAG